MVKMKIWEITEQRDFGGVLCRKDGSGSVLHPAKLTGDSEDPHMVYKLAANKFGFEYDKLWAEYKAEKLSLIHI